MYLHPTVKETLQLIGERRTKIPRIIFIHLNHTNPLHDKDSKELFKVEEIGWEVGEEGMEFTSFNVSISEEFLSH